MNVNAAHTDRVRRLFGRIAPRYDLMNRLMTFGRDIAWRKEAVRRLQLPSSGMILDAGAGTGDISRELLRQTLGATVIASDLTPQMVYIGKTRTAGANVHWVIADAQNLPFAGETFCGVICGYLLRNVADIDRVLKEERRVLRQGMRTVSLDTTPPQTNILKPLIIFYLDKIIPFLGRVITGEVEAYAYLPDTTERFLSAERLAERLSAAGFRGVGFARRMFGTMAIHWGEKG